MGQANLRGSFAERKNQAIASGNVKKGVFVAKVDSDHRGFSWGGHRNSGIYKIKPFRLNRPWKRRAAGL